MSLGEGIKNSQKNIWTMWNPGPFAGRDSGHWGAGGQDCRRSLCTQAALQLELTVRMLPPGLATGPALACVK